MRITFFLLLLALTIPAFAAGDLYQTVTEAPELKRLSSAIARLDPLDAKAWLLSLEQTDIYLKLTHDAEPDFKPEAAMPVTPERLAGVRRSMSAALSKGGPKGLAAWLAQSLEDGRVEAYRVVGAKDGKLRVTRYFAARVQARRKKEAPYTRALYRLPPESMRDAAGKLLTKQAIHAGAYEGKVPAIAYLTPASESELHMEGSGILVFPDGTETSVNYEGNNGYAWKEEDEDAKAVLKAEHGKVPWDYWPRFKKRHTFHRELKLEEFKHLKLQPGQYLGFDRPFLRKMPVQEHISCAMDPGLMPTGAVGLLIASGKSARSRLVKVDDQGGAFIGRPDKIDLFWGSFTKDELKAGKREDGTPLGEFPDWGELYFFAEAEAKR